MGMGAMHVKSSERRDRLWLISAFAVVLLTLLGAAGEALGYDRMLKTNTAKRRDHSWFRQGCILYDLIPTMPESKPGPRICGRGLQFFLESVVVPLDSLLSDRVSRATRHPRGHAAITPS